MDLNIIWHKPIILKDGSNEDLIYTASGIEKFDEVPGVYMFCRLYNDELFPLYIGRAKDIAFRINQQFNTTKLMKGIEKSPIGQKVLVVGEFKPKGGQNTESAIRLIESALIEHALSEGYELLNKSGTKTPVHKMSFSGNKMAKNFSGSTMFKKAKG